MSDTCVVVSGYVIAYSAGTVFFIHFLDFFPNIGDGILRDLEKFGMFTEIPDITGSGLFTIADSKLSVIGRVFKSLIIVKFHNPVSSIPIIPQTYNTYNI